MATTPVYGLRYREPTDTPDIAAGTQNLAEDVEAQIQRLDAAVPFRLLLKDDTLAAPSYSDSTVTTIQGFKVGPGDPGNGRGLDYSAGTVTVTAAGRAGIYHLEGQVAFNANATGYRQARFNVSGTAYRTQIAATSAGTTTVGISVDVYLAVGDTVTFQAYQNSGGTLAGPPDADMTRWSIRFVGPA